MNCSKCGEDKPPTPEFFVPAKDCRNGISKVCRACRAKYHRKWKRKNRERIRPLRRAQYADRYGPIQREKEHQRRLLFPLRVRAQVLRDGMRSRAKKFGLPFEGDALTTGRLMRLLAHHPLCACCATPLDLGFKNDRRMKKNSPSIDRFDPAQGYTVRNIELLCWRCNNLKRDASSAELRRVADWMDRRAERWGNEVESTVAMGAA